MAADDAMTEWMVSINSW